MGLICIHYHNCNGENTRLAHLLTMMIGGMLTVGWRKSREETLTAAPYSVALFPLKEQLAIRIWLVNSPLVVVPPVDCCI